MRFNIVQHNKSCEPGWIFDWSARNQVELEIHYPYKGEVFPDISQIGDALIVLGGDMNVDETNKYPWLLEEKKFIERYLKTGKPYLGICLGAQLVADVMGARVYKNTEKEIGWYPVELTSEGQRRWGNSQNGANVLHWHECVFDLPQGATVLAKTELTPVQAFVYKTQVMGFQFHPEVNKALVEPYLQDWEETPGKWIQSPEEIRRLAAYAETQKNILFTEMERVLKKSTRAQFLNSLP